MTATRTDGPISQLRAPAARRAGSAPWRDPRMAVGVALVALSVLGGAKVMATADDTVTVWAARADLAEGVRLGADDLVRTSLRFVEAESAGRYLLGTEPPPAGSTLARPVGAGELLPQAALGGGAASSLVEVPLAVAAESVPSGVRPGSVVDVWVTADPGAVNRRSSASLVFDDVTVVATPRSSNALGQSGSRQVVVGIPEEATATLGESLGDAASGAVVLTRRG